MGGRKAGSKNKTRKSFPNGKRPCVKCGVVKVFGEFHKHASLPNGVNNVCRECRKPLSKAAQAATTLEYRMFHRCKSRAKSKGLDFNLELSDFVVPALCPVFGMPLLVNDPEWAPSVDRIDNARGYVKGNIQIISNRANKAKSNLSLEELEQLVAFVKGDKCDIF